MYETFISHARKVTRSKTIEGREILKGVKHYENGSVVVTDSHRLYLMEDVHDLEEECVLSPSTGNKLKGSYPDVMKLIPDSADTTFKVDVNELYKGIDIINVASRIEDVDYCMDWEDSTLSYSGDKGLLTASYELPFELPTTFTLSSNSRYWVEALQLFRALRYREMEISIIGKLRPFTLKSLDGKLTVLLLPIRRF